MPKRTETGPDHGPDSTIGGDSGIGGKPPPDGTKRVPRWVWVILVFLGILLLILLLLKSCDSVYFSNTPKLAGNASQVEKSPVKAPPLATHIESDQGSASQEPPGGGAPNREQRPHSTEASSQNETNVRLGRSNPGQTSSNQTVTSVTLGTPTDATGQSGEAQPLTEPQHKIKRVTDRLIEGTKVLTIDPPDPKAKWRINIPENAPAEVIADKAGHLRFLSSPSWDQAIGDEVKIKFTAPSSGQRLTAEVIAKDSQGFETVYILTVGEK